MKTTANKHLLKITTAAVMIAFTCVLTMAVRIPSPTKGYLNLGDLAVLLSGWLLGPLYGSIAAGVGSALADLFAGYPVYVPGTLLVKAAMALIVSLVPARVKRDGESRPILELLRVSRAFDLGLFYQPADINKQLIYRFRQGDSDWTSVYAAYSEPAAAALEKIDLAFEVLKKK